jgi:hypothetical protein
MRSNENVVVKLKILTDRRPRAGGKVRIGRSTHTALIKTTLDVI